MAQGGLYPGQGQRLALASSNPEEPVWLSMRHADYTIPDGDNTMGVALNAGLVTVFNAEFGTAPTGTAFSIMYDTNKDFSTEYVLDSVTSVASQKSYSWSTDSLISLTGFARLANSGGEDIIKATVQQTASFS